MAKLSLDPSTALKGKFTLDQLINSVEQEALLNGVSVSVIVGNSGSGQSVLNLSMLKTCNGTEMTPALTRDSSPIANRSKAAPGPKDKLSVSLFCINSRRFKSEINPSLKF